MNPGRTEIKRSKREKKGMTAFDKGVGRVLARSLGLTSSALRPQAEEAEKRKKIN